MQGGRERGPAPGVFGAWCECTQKRGEKALGNRGGGRYAWPTMSDSDPKTVCGPHTEIVKTEGIRISRCTCGTIHVNLVRNGTTVQVAPEYFAEIAQAMSLAKTVLAGAQEPAPAPALQPTTPFGGFITIPVMGGKKPSN